MAGQEWLSFGSLGLLGFLCDRLQIFAQLSVCEPSCAAEMFAVSLQGVWGSSLHKFLSIAVQRLLGSLACGIPVLPSNLQKLMPSSVRKLDQHSSANKPCQLTRISAA